MKSALAVFLIGVGSTGVFAAQKTQQPVMKQGIHVQMAVSKHAIEIPAADKPNATVVTLTAEGKLFLGVQPVDVDALGNLQRSTVYVKADSRASYQQVLNVISALRGFPLVLLTEPVVKAESGKITPPYGLRLKVEAQ